MIELTGEQATQRSNMKDHIARTEKANYPFATIPQYEQELERAAVDVVENPYGAIGSLIVIATDLLGMVKATDPAWGLLQHGNV